ncbi:MAG: RNA polymerase sigma factor, RpoD/SigA family [Phormidesmis sp.]
MQVTLSTAPGQNGDRRRPQTKPQDPVGAYLREIGRFPLLSADEEISLGHQVQLMMRLLAVKETLSKEIGRPPDDAQWASQVQLSVEDLQAAIQIGKQAKKRMMEGNLRLVVSVAKKYQGRDLDLLDLIQEGSIGLERGVEKFDPTMGYKFSTYAYWWIRQGITRAIASTARTIRLPIHITEKLNKIKRIQRELTQSLGRAPRLKEVADQLEMPLPELKNYLQLSSRPLSLDMRVGEESESSELIDFLESPDVLPEDSVSNRLFAQDLRNMLERLTAQQKNVLTLRYGLQDGVPRTLASVGEEMGISRERVRQIERQALTSLRLKKESMRDYL